MLADKISNDSLVSVYAHVNFFRRNELDSNKEGKIGAGNETRTRDFHLGKVVLYQLSYSRFADALSNASSTRPSILAHGGYVSIALAHCRTFKGKVAITNPWLSKRFFNKNCFDNLAIADS